MANIIVRIISAIWNNVIGYIREYCNSSSIHGFRYFGEKRSCCERIWWMLVFAICLLFLTKLLEMVYYQWQFSLIIVSPTNYQDPIHKIPFPAVTICPEKKSYQELYSHKDMVLKLLNHEKLTFKEFQEVSFMNLICDTDIMEALVKQSENDSLNVTLNDYSYADEEFYNFLYSIFPDVDYFFSECKFMGKYLNCSDIFKLIITEEGLCFTFNMFDQSMIYKSSLYSVNDTDRKINYGFSYGYRVRDIDTYPQRALYSGSHNALSVTLKESKIDLDPVCKYSHHGFRVTLHNAMEIPRPRQHFFRVSSNQTVLAATRPVLVRALFDPPSDPFKWGCYDEPEEYLGYYYLYTQQNCLLECLANFTREWCGCVSFYMPRDNHTDRICGFLNEKCVKEAEAILERGSFYFHYMKIDKKNLTRSTMNKLFSCNCLPLCTYLSYEVQMSSSPWDWADLYATLFPKKFVELQESQTSLSKLIIYLEEPYFSILTTVELYGASAALGDIGGLLSLFTGFSVISLMELVYFLTVRIICNFRLYGSLASKPNSHRS